MNSKKILYLGNKLSRHGVTPTSVETLGKLLEGEGYAFFFASDKLNKGLRLLDMWWQLIRHRREIDKLMIDTYTNLNFFYAWSSAWLARRFNIPYYPILRGGLLHKRLERTPKMSHNFFSQAAINIVPSGYLQEVFRRAGYDTVLIPNNLDIRNYPFRERNQLRPRLLWVRSFCHIYNPQMAIRLVNELRGAYPEVALTMMGPDKDGSMAECQALARKLGVADRITFTGGLSKPEWIRRSADFDIFINTTNADNMPVSVMEAMALGFPIVSTNVGGVPYLVDDGHTGLLVDKGDLQSMVDRIHQLLTAPSMAANLSVAAREAAQEYDWQTVKRLWFEVLGQPQRMAVNVAE